MAKEKREKASAKPAKRRAHARTALGKELKASLKEAVEWARGERELPVRTYHPPADVPVEPVRRKLGLTQENFARMFGLTVGTVRDWEQGRRHPEGPARTLLAIIDRHPEIVREVLHAGPRP